MDTKKLRQKILDLAIRGKLVPQDPNDEPASVLLERIRAEKERLIKEGKIKRSKKSTSDTPHYENVPFKVPEGWEWCTIDDIAESNIGLTYKPSDISNEGVPVYRSNNIQNRSICLDDVVRVDTQILEKQYLHESDLLICARNGSRNLVGKCALIPKLSEPTTFGAFMAVCRSSYNKWIFLLLNSDYFDAYLDDSNSTAINQVTQKMLLAFQMPFPPVNEQDRIYNEVCKWFSVIDILEFEERDLKLSIEKAKSKILDLAIHGKLVPQDPNDEPAIELLKRINPKFTPCDNAHKRNQIPDSWIWCTLQDSFKITMGSSPTGDTLNREKLGIEFHQGKVFFSNKYILPSDIYSTQPVKLAEPLSILLCVRAPVGTVNITDRQICIGRGLCSLIPSKSIDLQYAYYVLQTCSEELEQKATGSTFKAVGGDVVKNQIIPLPPINEQRRIVAKIEGLYSVLDEIQKSIEA